MTWIQPVDPLHNLTLSALVAIVPVLVIFWALIIKKTKGYKASLMACAVATLIALTVYGMPAKLAFLSIANGALYGFFPICWIVISAVFLFNLTVKSGQFEIIKHSMATITADRRLQAILIAFSFGAFLEGTAGFGAPVAITAAMLVGLEFDALYATGLCLVANTVPVAFGSVGIPIAVASQVSGLPEMQISQMIGRTLPLLSLITPLYLVILMSGFKKAMEVFPAILISGGSFALLQFFTANFIGPALPDIIAGIGSIVVLVVFLRFWKPTTIWRFKNEKPPLAIVKDAYSLNQIITAWAPFLLLTIIILTWGLPPVKEFLNARGQWQFAFPGLHNAIADSKGIPLSHIFKFNYLSAAGTAVFLAALAAIPVVGLTFSRGLKVFGETMNQLKLPIVTIMSVLSFAYMVNDSGITTTIALLLANTGPLFPFFAPVLGWLGVFITGSDTASNALFARLQYVTATRIGVAPVVTVAANCSGGVVGKMISPQSIAVAAAAGNLVGKESALFRFTLKHSFIILLFLSLLVLGQAYWFTGIIPVAAPVSALNALPLKAALPGYVWLILTALIIAVFIILLKLTGEKDRQKKIL
ncbi:L-lactate permease [Mucilaginibacter sp. UR6-11]|uniref:L-lactate permease n=1 Tax=Mucilaginibacter sp. UR6-11 TaxID=1435644 RepID=UPI001E4DAF8A|nr:lactate permease LctP family transporter [Mucilaginibacter sp. UR6-11]MCC8424670.1 lactate permease LctP family transporter [Mucilaginibacter sp. UR6-11]